MYDNRIFEDIKTGLQQAIALTDKSNCNSTREWTGYYDINNEKIYSNDTVKIFECNREIYGKVIQNPFLDIDCFMIEFTDKNRTFYRNVSECNHYAELVKEKQNDIT